MTGAGILERKKRKKGRAAGGSSFMVGDMARPTAAQKAARRERYEQDSYRKKKPDSAYYVNMAQAIGEVRRVSDTVAMDEAGQLIKVNSDVVRIGSGIKAPIMKVQSGNDFIGLFIGFTEWIRNNGFKEYPTKLNFSRWAGLSYETIYNYLTKNYSEKQKAYQEILADTLTEGVNAGAYDRQMSIFCLKNWSGWADRSESVTVSKAEPVTKEQADALIKQYVESLPSE